MARRVLCPRPNAARTGVVRSDDKRVERNIVPKKTRAPLFGASIDNLRRRPTGRWRRVCDRQLLPRDLERSRLLGPLLVWIAAALESNREGLVRFVDRVGAEAGDTSLDGRLVLFRRALHAALGDKIWTVGAQDMRGIVTAFRKDRETFRIAPPHRVAIGALGCGGHERPGSDEWRFLLRKRLVRSKLGANAYASGQHQCDVLLHDSSMIARPRYRAAPAVA